MGTQLPKVLLPLVGRPLLAHVLDAVRGAGVVRVVVVVGAGREQVLQQFAGMGLEFAVQAEPKGTADAVLACRRLVADDEECVIVYGDVPLMNARTIVRLVDARRRRNADVAVLTAVLDDPSGYGRVVRGDSDTVESIVEERDADTTTRQVREVNSGFCSFVWGRALPALQAIEPSPVSGEYYLTDAVRVIRNRGGTVVAVAMDNPEEMMGVNTPDQFQAVARAIALRRASRSP